MLLQWISRLIFLIMNILSPLRQKWCYNVKQKLSIVKLSGLYKSKSHDVLAPKSVSTNVTAKSHAGGPQAEPWQFSAASWRNFTVCFCSVHQQEERTWVQFSLVVGIPRIGICRAELSNQEPHPHRTLWLKMQCFVYYPSIRVSLWISDIIIFLGNQYEKQFLREAVVWQSALLSTLYSPSLRGEEQGLGGCCLSLRATFGWGRHVPWSMVPSSLCCSITLSQNHFANFLHPASVSAPPETKMSSTHPQVFPPKLPTHAAWKPDEFLYNCHSFSPSQSSHPSFECKLLMALTAWPSIWNTLVPIQHHKLVSRLRKNMDIRSYLFMFIFLLFVFIYSSFLLKFYSCQLAHRIRASGHPCRVFTSAAPRMSPVLYISTSFFQCVEHRRAGWGTWEAHLSLQIPW